VPPGGRAGPGATTSPSGGRRSRDASARWCPQSRSAASRPAARWQRPRPAAPATPGPATSAARMHPRPLPLRDRELMTQHQDLGVLPPRLPARQPAVMITLSDPVPDGQLQLACPLLSVWGVVQTVNSVGATAADDGEGLGLGEGGDCQMWRRSYIPLGGRGRMLAMLVLPGDECSGCDHHGKGRSDPSTRFDHAGSVANRSRAIPALWLPSPARSTRPATTASGCRTSPGSGGAAGA
jgi:hypothetical protein